MVFTVILITTTVHTMGDNGGIVMSPIKVCVVFTLIIIPTTVNTMSDKTGIDMSPIKVCGGVYSDNNTENWSKYE